MTSRIIHVFHKVFNELGFVFIESVYREAMTIALVEVGLLVTTEVPIPCPYQGHLIGFFRADILVQHKVTLELKTAEQISKAHEAQLLHSLRASTIEVGLVLNSGSTPKFRRLEFRNERKQSLNKFAFIPC